MGQSFCQKRWKANDLTSSLERDLKRYNIYANETPRSFRHGWTVHTLKTGSSLKTTMYKAFMNNKQTAWVYSKGLSVLYPEDFDWKEAGVDTSTMDEDELSFQMQSWRAFVNEKIPFVDVHFKACYICLSLTVIGQIKYKKWVGMILWALEKVAELPGYLPIILFLYPIKSHPLLP